MSPGVETAIRASVAGGAGVEAGRGAGSAGVAGTCAEMGGSFSRRWYSAKLTVCGSPSSVTTKSRSVSPSMGLPSLSFTLTVWMTSLVPLRNVGCCAEPGTNNAQNTSKNVNHKGHQGHKGASWEEECFVSFVSFVSIVVNAFCQNLSLAVVCNRRMVFAWTGNPNCGL